MQSSNKFTPVTRADHRWLSEGGYYDHSLPEKVRLFARECCSIADRPDMVEFEFLPWQWENVICPLYGCRNADGLLRFARGSIWCPRKLAKSITFSVVMLFEMFRVPAPQIYVVSSAIESAEQIFNFAAYSIENGPLNDILHIQHHKKQITFKDRKLPGLCKVLSGGKKGRSGQGATCVLIDELGEISDETAWQRLYQSSRAREKDSPIWLSISSPQYERYDLPFAQYEKAKAIIDGEDTDPNYLAKIVSVPESIPIDDVEACAKHLPNVPAVISLKYLKKEYEDAKGTPRDLARYRNHSLGQWAWGTDNYWLDWSKIDKCFVKFTDESLHKQRCLIGLDGAMTNLACYVLYFPETKQVIPRFFIPHDTAEKEDNSGSYSYFAHQQYINITTGNRFDPKVIKASLLKDIEDFQVDEIGFDPYRLEATMDEFMEDVGVTTSVVPPNKSYVARPTKELERLVQSEELKIQFNPIAKQNLRAAMVREDSHENIVLDRDLSKGRYDFVAALVICLNRVIAAENREFNIFTL